MNEQNLQAGDVVCLKSGSDPMTMREPYRDTSGVLHAFCDWHEGTTPMGRVYPLSALVKYEPSGDRPKPPPQNPIGFTPPELS